MLPSPFGFNNSAFAYCAHHVSNATTDYVSLKVSGRVVSAQSLELKSTLPTQSPFLISCP
jgi:hypothetical protein